MPVLYILALISTITTVADFIDAYNKYGKLGFSSVLLAFCNGLIIMHYTNLGTILFLASIGVALIAVLYQNNNYQTNYYNR